MVTCPNCHGRIHEKTTVCECGAILFGQVTNIAPWETETVFSAAPPAAKRKMASLIGVAALVLLGGLFLALPKLSTSTRVNETSSEPPETTQTQSQTRSDLIPSDDLMEQADAFMPNVKMDATAVAAKPSRLAKLPGRGGEPVSTAVNSLDQQLLTDSPDIASKKSADQANCDPEAAPTLKKSEPPIAETKKLAESTTSPYMLGPRGGCFIVTSSGGKKYVDRGLCAPAAARQ